VRNPERLGGYDSRLHVPPSIAQYAKVAPGSLNV